MAGRPSSSDSSTSTGTGAESRPPGLGAQFGRTRTALIGLVAAHFKLLSAELSEIMGEVKRALALGGIAVVLLIMAGMLVFVGSILWLGESVFGSIGWGVLDGSAFLIAVAVTLGLLILPHAGPRIGLAIFISALAAVAVFLVFWLQLSSRAWGWVGSSFFAGLTWFDGHAVSAADRPTVVAVLFFAVVLGAIGAIVGRVLGRGLVGRVVLAVGIAGGAAILGGRLGGLFGVPMSWVISLAVALTIFLVLCPILGAILVLPRTDFGELRDRFIPMQTIETTKETIEWVREQMPLGRKS